MKLKDTIMRGTSGSRPSASMEGLLYYQTDTKDLYRDNGATWETMSVGGDGWILSGSMTYISSSAVTVSSGATNIYSVGDKIRFQNNSSGSYLYDYITGVDDTILTLAGDSVPNATLTNIYYSKASIPLGFPSGFSFTPIWKTASDPQPVLNSGSSSGYFTMSGRLVTMYNKFTFSAATTFGSGYFYFGLPTLSTPISGVNTAWRGTLVIFDAGTNWRIGVCYYAANVGGNLYLVGAIDSAADLMKSDIPITFTTNDEIELQFSYGI
jgi:hypothetical protein